MALAPLSRAALRVGASWFVVSLALLGVGALSPVDAAPRPLTVTAEPLALKPDEPNQMQVGDLSYRGGVILTSDDTRFGGISGLAVDPNSLWAVMVTDQGSWIEGQLVFTDGMLTGLSNARIGPLLNTRGNAIGSKRRGDAEAVEWLGDGFVVSFENDHKLWRYPSAGFDAPFMAVPEDLGLPADFSGIPSNGALESVAVVGGGLVLLTERAEDGNGDTRGWIGPVSGARERFQAWTLITDGPYAPTDMAPLPGGDILVLERSYSPFTGVSVQLRRVAGRALRPYARLPGRQVARMGRGFSVDNMEGLSTVSLSNGSVLVLMVSDDNFNEAQKTILLAFTMAP